MFSEVSVGFRVPLHAYEILTKLYTQNRTLSFELDNLERTVTLHGYMVDFPPYADDWEEDDFEASGFWDGVE